MNPKNLQSTQDPETTLPVQARRQRLHLTNTLVSTTKLLQTPVENTDCYIKNWKHLLDRLAAVTTHDINVLVGLTSPRYLLKYLSHKHWTFSGTAFQKI